ncbi:MAG: GTP 3',8-cyclase MoaA [Candidatus Bathyarchaeota archaeon]|nr:GTP 3',8-cyclase MoaA [Candidatus Bathyarchaeota archaeon]
MPLRDPYGRPIISLRVSVTHRCNFSCFFCHQEGENSPGAEMTPEEISKVVDVAAELGVKKIKITGGEPLIRDDIVEIIQRISPSVEEVSMTTNASRLAELAAPLKAAGLARVNVSFHTLHPKVFRDITCSDEIEAVKQGIKTAINEGLTPLKLNFVVMKGVNEREIPDMLKFSAETGAVLQLIEYQALEKGVNGFGDHHFDLTPLEDSWSREATRIVEREMHHRHQYTLPSGAVVEVVRPMHNTIFCANCNRLRLTSDGKLKPCLMRDDNLIPLADLIRRGEPRERLMEAFKEAVAQREPYWRN